MRLYRYQDKDPYVCDIMQIEFSDIFPKIKTLKQQCFKADTNMLIPNFNAI